MRPKAILFVKTDNPEQFMRVWKEVDQHGHDLSVIIHKDALDATLLHLDPPRLEKATIGRARQLFPATRIGQGIELMTPVEGKVRF